MTGRSPNRPVESDARTEGLRFRRQFFLGPTPLGGLEGWHRVQLTDKFALTIHPDLEFHRAVAGGRSLTLLGFLLDPEDPAATSLDILERLLREMDDAVRLPELTNMLGGRWALLAMDERRSILFHDAGGQRSVYYGRRAASEGIRCASQPGLLATALDASIDPEARDSMCSPGCRTYWLPGDTSLFEGIRALLPNHYLDLDQGTAHRYWPTSETELPRWNDPVAESARILERTVEAAARRYPLALSMTAGWDSRLTLALGRPHRDRLYSFTLAYHFSPRDIPDHTIPARLLSRLGMAHRLLLPPARIDGSFDSACREANPSAKETSFVEAQALLEGSPPGRLCITGDVAEVVKCLYRNTGGEGEPLTPHGLASLCRAGSHPFAIRAFEFWLAGAPRAGPIHLLDLFCWEQMVGRWQALIRSEFDIVQDSFSPLNSRHLVMGMLTVDEGERRPPDHVFLRRLIERLWPEVLMEPINPPEPVRLRNVVSRVLDGVGMSRSLRDRLRRLRGI